VKSVLARIARGESVALPQPPVDRFERTCRVHTALTKEKLIPLAAVLLNDPELQLIGRSMAERHGVTPHAPACLCAA